MAVLKSAGQFLLGITILTVLGVLFLQLGILTGGNNAVVVWGVTWVCLGFSLGIFQDSFDRLLYGKPHR